MNYWPGTKIIKSHGNAFDWRKGVSQIASTKSFKVSQNATIANAGAGSDPNRAFTIYSRAKSKA